MLAVDQRRSEPHTDGGVAHPHLHADLTAGRHGRTGADRGARPDGGADRDRLDDGGARQGRLRRLPLRPTLRRVPAQRLPTEPEAGRHVRDGLSAATMRPEVGCGLAE